MPPRLLRFASADQYVDGVALPMRVGSNVAYHAGEQRLYIASDTPLEAGGPRVDRYDGIATSTAGPETVLEGTELPRGADGEPTHHFPLAATPAGGFVVGHPRAYRIVEHGAEGDARIRLWRIVVADGGPFTPPATP